MVLRKFMGIFAITLIVYSASLVMAEIPDASQCDANRFEGGVKAILLVVPGSSADHPFDEAVAIGVPPGAPQVKIDATIQVTVRDGSGVEIADYPFEDIWLECPVAANPPGDPAGDPGFPAHAGLVACVGGATADFNTDVAGYTEFRNPPFAGGQSYGQTTVVINGDGLSNSVDVSFNSPDLDGNGVVNLLDLAGFTSDFFDGLYHYRSDLFFDSAINLVDLPAMARYYASSCP